MYHINGHKVSSGSHAVSSVSSVFTLLKCMLVCHLGFPTLINSPILNYRKDCSNYYGWDDEEWKSEFPIYMTLL